MLSILRLAWSRYTLVSMVVGEVVGRVIVTAFYFTILVPFGLGSRLFSDPLHLKAQPVWLERPAVPSDMNSAQEQG